MAEKFKRGTVPRAKPTKAEDLLRDDGLLISSTKVGTKAIEATRLADQMINPEKSGSTGMYANMRNPEDLIEQFGRGVANRRKGQPWRYPSAEALRSEIMLYLRWCIDRRIAISIAGLCAWLGISVATLKYWAKHQAICPLYWVAEEVIAFIHAVHEQSALDGTINVGVFKFLSSNLYGYSDSLQVISSFDTQESALDIASLIENLPDTDPID